jgi:hypothetical protein
MAVRVSGPLKAACVGSRARCSPFEDYRETGRGACGPVRWAVGRRAVRHEEEVGAVAVPRATGTDLSDVADWTWTG